MASGSPRGEGANTISVQVGGFSLRCAVSGDGERHITCLHGLVDTLDIWRRMASELACRGRLLQIDQRGHGGSGGTPQLCTRRDMAGDVIAVLDTLGIERTTLLAHSMGGVVAMECALAFTDRVEGLALIATTSQASRRVAGWYERIALAGEHDGLSGLARAIYGEDSSRQIEGDPVVIAQVTRMLARLADDPLTPRLAALDCPVLLLVGERDPMGPKASELIHEAIGPDRSRLEVIAGAGHWLHVERPETVLARLDSWWL